MTTGSSRLVAIFVVLTAVAVAVVVMWLAFFRPRRTVVHEPGSRTVLVAPPRTPLRDSGPRNNPKHVKTRQPGTPAKLARPPSTQVDRRKVGSPSPGRRVTPTRPKAAPKHKAAPQKSSPPPGQTTSPSPPPKSPVTVTAPVPVQVCVRGVGGVNCP